jgi:hypothetical protein
MKKICDLHVFLLSSLVAEFRACQALYAQLINLRTALLFEEAAQIVYLAATIESGLKQVRQLGAARQRLLAQHPIPVDQTLTTVQTNLLDGVEVMNAQIDQLLRCNNDLARNALEHSNRSQTHLAELFDPSSAIVPFPAPAESHKSLPAMLSAILSARDALYLGDIEAVTAALGDLQTNLHALAQTLHPELPADAETSVIEKIANLYRRSNAYRVVLQSNSSLQV